LEDRFAVADGREVDEEDTVLEPVDLVRRRLQSQTRLANPSGPGQRQQPDAVRVEQVANGAQLDLAAEELRRLRREVVGALAEGRERRQVALELGMRQLEDVLRLREVLEPVLAEVAQP
jgi:hypothetical protein